MYADEFIEQLATELGITDLSFNSENVARMIVGEEVVIDLERLEGQRQIQVYSSLGPPPTSEAALRELLSANLFGRATGGAVIALDDEQDEVVLCQSFDPETLPMQQCLEELNTFAHAAAFWTNRLAGGELDDDKGAPADPPDPGMLRI